MRFRHETEGQSALNEGAFLAVLAALNVKFEAARAGKPGFELGHSAAQTSDALINPFLKEIKSDKT